jgi:phosphoribosylformylglycinamidine cyclo-ligase
MRKPHSRSLTYADAGVNIDAAVEAKKRIKRLARDTFSPGVLTDIGSFGALFKFDKEAYEEPLLVSSCDGVGTKLKVAAMTRRHDTVGYDLVSHCVSDIMVQGARPLFFLDYIACGKLEPDIVEQIVSGLVRGCQETGCALIGGETAEMPDFYVPGEYDLAGFIVGVVDRKKVVDGTKIKPGDCVLGLASLGLHTNGYSLARRIVFDLLGHQPGDFVSSLQTTVAEMLLMPHRNYFPLLEPLLNTRWLKGMAHITGGGITENLPRILPPGTAATIHRDAWPVLPVFDYLRSRGNIGEVEMFRTFNMGIGMILVVSAEDSRAVRENFALRNEPCYEIGSVAAGDGKVHYA